ncbi:MAG TPA: cobalt ABC transporter permease, partial [Candidatus Kurthia intestinigallinarum]|nr:cobalt ABC transporter permease [Candidatus Kurthia intestinigallinarum]
MMGKMIFGRFLPGDSIVHKMDPRAKLLFVFIFIVAVFLANNVWSYAVLLAFTFLVMTISKIKLRYLINGLKPVMI